jgi:hypothetical protein
MKYAVLAILLLASTSAYAQTDTNWTPLGGTPLSPPPPTAPPPFGGTPLGGTDIR